MFQALSQELIDYIIDTLAIVEDESSTRNCSLVSSVFRERSQFHLFRSITLRWRTARGPSPDVIQRLHEVLRDRPVLARATISLIVDFDKNSAHIDGELSSIKEILGWLVNLERFMIANCYHDNNNGSSFVERIWRPHILPRAKEITLFVNTSLPIGLFTECPNLDNLRIMVNWIRNYTQSRVYAPENVPPMKPKSLFCHSIENLWLVIGGVGSCRIDFSALTSITWFTTAWTPQQDGEAIRFITSQASATLERLMFSGNIGTYAGSMLSLAEMTCLRKLSLFARHHEDYNSQLLQETHQCVPGVTSILSTISRKSGLRYLRFFVDILCQDLNARDSLWLRADAEHWCSFDEVVSRWQKVVDESVTLELSFRVSKSSDASRASYYEILAKFPSSYLPLTSCNSQIELLYAYVEPDQRDGPDKTRLVSIP